MFDLKKPINLKSPISLAGKKITKERYPEKTSINLIEKDKGISDPKQQIVLFAIFMVLLMIFVKFMVIDLIIDSAKAQNEYQTTKSTIAKLKDNNQDYEEIRAEYSHYGNGYLNDEESIERNRKTMMTVIDTDVLSMANITGIDISGNVAKITVDGVTLNTVSSIVDSLKQESTVSFVTVSTAGTTNSDSSVTSTLTVNFKAVGGGK